MEIKTGQIEIVDINTIKLNPENLNKHPKDQIDQLAKIIEYNGFRRPLTISNRTGQLNCGEGRYWAAKKLKMEKVPVMFQDYDDEEHEFADAVADNQIDKQSLFDFAMLNVKLPDLGPLDMDILGLKNFKIDIADKENFDPNKEWADMPEFNQGDKSAFRTIIVHFENQEMVNRFFAVINQNFTDKTKSIWFPEQIRIEFLKALS